MTMFAQWAMTLLVKFMTNPNPVVNEDYSVNMNGAAFRFKAVRPQAVSRAIGELTSSKSFGVDMISI